MIATDAKRDYSINLFLVLLCAVSGSLLLSMGFLLPVINSAKKSKEVLLELFLTKKIEKSIDE